MVSKGFSKNMVRQVRRASVAQLMLAIFSTGIVAAVLHLTFVTHVFLEDGTIAELDPLTGDPIPENQNGNPLDEGCPYLSELTIANTLVSHDVVAIMVVQVVDHMAPQGFTRDAFTPDDVYLLSPSNSPPHRV